MGDSDLCIGIDRLDTEDESSVVACRVTAVDGADDSDLVGLCGQTGDDTREESSS